MNISHFRSAGRCFAVGLLALLTACASMRTSTNTTRPSDRPITADIAGQYALYAMMSANAYHSEKRISFPIEMMGWQQMYAKNQPTTGPTTRHALADFSYNIWYHEKDDRYVFAYRVGDFGVVPARQKARKGVEQFQHFHPGKSITLTGHAAGGGLALTLSKLLGLHAVTFDPSPAEFTYPLADATNRLVVQHAATADSAAPAPQCYRGKFDYGRSSYQLADVFALELLKVGAPANPSLATLRDLVLFEGVNNADARD